MIVKLSHTRALLGLALCAIEIYGATDTARWGPGEYARLKETLRSYTVSRLRKQLKLNQDYMEWLAVNSQSDYIAKYARERKWALEDAIKRRSEDDIVKRVESSRGSVEERLKLLERLNNSPEFVRSKLTHYLDEVNKGLKYAPTQYINMGKKNIDLTISNMKNLKAMIKKAQLNFIFKGLAKLIKEAKPAPKYIIDDELEELGNEVCNMIEYIPTVTSTMKLSAKQNMDLETQVSELNENFEALKEWQKMEKLKEQTIEEQGALEEKIAEQSPCAKDCSKNVGTQDQASEPSTGAVGNPEAESSAEEDKEMSLAERLDFSTQTKKLSKEEAQSLFESLIKRFDKLAEDVKSDAERKENEQENAKELQAIFEEFLDCCSNFKKEQADKCWAKYDAVDAYIDEVYDDSDEYEDNSKSYELNMNQSPKEEELKEQAIKANEHRNSLEIPDRSALQSITKDLEILTKKVESGNAKYKDSDELQELSEECFDISFRIQNVTQATSNIFLIAELTAKARTLQEKIAILENPMGW